MGLTVLWKSVQKYKYVVVIIVVGIVFLVLPGIGEKEQADTDRNSEVFDVERFEKRIELALADCEGIGRTEVILSVESGPEYVYAKEAKQSMKEQEKGVMRESDSDTRPSIMSEGSGKESPIVIKELYPEFRGALVICDGADDISVRSKVTNSVSALTALTSDRISVVKMKK